MRGEGRGAGATAAGGGAGGQPAALGRAKASPWRERVPFVTPRWSSVPGRRGLGPGRGAAVWARFSPRSAGFVGKHVCSAVFVVLPLARFSDSSGKTYPSVRKGVTSPTACAALIKWLRSRGFDLFLKQSQRCLLPPSHQQAKLSPKALGSVAAARGSSSARSLRCPGCAGGSGRGRGGQPRVLRSVAGGCSGEAGAGSRRGLPSLRYQREELSA